MKPSLIALASLLALTLAPVDTDASSVGSSYYNPKPRPVKQASAHIPCETGGCVGHAACGECRRLGFACVDHATPAPCTAEGGCTPKQESFGYHETRWRRWPGTGGDEGSKLDPSDAEDSLLGPFDPPVPQDEDQQAPPPIQESAPFEEPADDGQGPAFEIDLPPLPEGVEGQNQGFRGPDRPRGERPRPEPPARPGFGNGPPPPPFGLVRPRPSREQTAIAPLNDASRSQETNWALPPLPMGSGASSDNPSAAESDDAPPPLPSGFTRFAPSDAARRLPVATKPRKIDASIRRASATGPITLLPAR